MPGNQTRATKLSLESQLRFFINVLNFVAHQTARIILSLIPPTCDPYALTSTLATEKIVSGQRGVLLGILLDQVESVVEEAGTQLTEDWLVVGEAYVGMGAVDQVAGSDWREITATILPGT
jgi:hypothetical protein